MAHYYRYGDSWISRLTPAVRFILIITGLLFVLQQLNGPWFTLLFSLSSAALSHLFLWQFVTYIFLHSGIWHILLNMLGLFFFGPETERAIGSSRFVALYLLSGILGGIGWLLLKGAGGGICLGASGAIFGVLGAFAGLFPHRPVTLLLFFVIPVTLRARTLAIGLGLFTFFAMISQPNNIAYAAHLVGGLAGYLYIQMFFNRSAPGLWPPSLWLQAAARAINGLRWRWLRRKYRVIATPPPSYESDAPAPAEVDAVLAKIAKWGLGNLSQRERDILDRASRRR